MYSGAFDYAAPTSLGETLQLLQTAQPEGSEVKLLAGGQSLIPLIKLRLAQPALLVDLRQGAEPRGIAQGGGGGVLGAAPTHLPADGSGRGKPRRPLPGQ